MRLRLKLITLAISLASTGAFAAGNGYQGLPGVKSPAQLATENNQSNCTSGIGFRYFYDRRKMPTRVYNCREGAVTYQSTMPPLYEQRSPDPYSHGEGPIKPLGTLR